MSDFWGEDDDDEEGLDEGELSEDDEVEMPGGSDSSSSEPYTPPPMPPLRRASDAIPPDSTPIPATDPQPDVVQVATQSRASSFAGIVGGLAMVGLSVAIDVFSLLAPAAGAIQELPLESAGGAETGPLPDPP